MSYIQSSSLVIRSINQAVALAPSSSQEEAAKKRPLAAVEPDAKIVPRRPDHPPPGHLKVTQPPPPQSNANLQGAASDVVHTVLRESTANQRPVPRKNASDNAARATPRPLDNRRQRQLPTAGRKNGNVSSKQSSDTYGQQLSPEAKRRGGVDNLPLQFGAWLAKII